MIGEIKDIDVTEINGEWESYRFYTQPDKSDPLNQLRLLELKNDDKYHRIIFRVDKPFRVLSDIDAPKTETSS